MKEFVKKHRLWFLILPAMPFALIMMLLMESLDIKFNNFYIAIQLGLLIVQITSMVLSIIYRKELL